jgi:hypothetical protein
MGALSRAPHRIMCPLPLLTSSFRGVKCQLRGSRFIPINTDHSSAQTIGPRPLSPYKRGEPRRPPPHLLLVSFSSSRAQAPLAPSANTTASSPPSLSRHTNAYALVRPETDSPCAPLSIAPSPVSHRALERPLGQAPASPSAGHGRSPPWTGASCGP